MARMKAGSRALACALLILPLCAAAAPPGPALAIYDSNPQSLWNRLYRAIAVRTEGAVPYGVDNTVPFDEPFDDPGALSTVLDEFLDQHAEQRSPSDLARALLLNDVWAAFDLAAGPRGGPQRSALQRPLAQLLGRLRLSRAAIDALPDNYLQAVRSADFAADFDPAHPERAFLPPDLFDPGGPWVEIEDGRGGLVAPFHVEELSGRSVFRVFIRCPGGRQATLAYLDALNLYPTPLRLNSQDIATAYPSGRKLRANLMRLDPATPQFPAGTMVALVRQMMVIDDRLEPVATDVTQTVLLRVYRRVGLPFTELGRDDFSSRQLVYEFAMRRRDLLTGKAGGLRSLGPDHREYQGSGEPFVSFGDSRATLLRGPLVLSTCVRCHQGDGIFSVDSYTRIPSELSQNPQLLPAGTLAAQVGLPRVGSVRAATAAWKQQQFNWGLLLGLLERDTGTP